MNTTGKWLPSLLLAALRRGVEPLHSATYCRADKDAEGLNEKIAFYFRRPKIGDNDSGTFYNNRWNTYVHLVNRGGLRTRYSTYLINIWTTSSYILNSG